jgi:hypothetical protein
MNTSFLSTAAALPILAFCSISFAQEVDVRSSPPNASPPAPTTVVVAPPAAAPVHESVAKKEDPDYAHFRFGLGLDANYLVTPGTNGFQGLGAGVQVRLGAQMNQWIAVYYQAHGIVGGTLENSGNLAGATLVGMVFNSGLLEATLPLLHLGVGPSADVIGVAGLSQERPTNVYFGIDGRAAIVIGGHGPGRHGGFAINFNVHPTFWGSNVLTTFSAGVGGEMY